MAIGTTAAILLPSCLSEPRRISIALQSLAVNGDDEALLAELAETLIPETDTPGAKTTMAHHFTLVMIDDCQPDDIKTKYVNGLRSFEDACRKLGGKTFMESNSEERVALLRQVEANIDQFPEEVRTFYHFTRRYIIQGYTSSSFFLTNVKPYELVPGPNFKGCVPVDESFKAT